MAVTASPGVVGAKRDLEPGEILDGEGGYTVWGKLMPAKNSVAVGALPIGLASNIRLKRALKKDQVVTAEDVEPAADTQAWRIRAEMLQRFQS